MSKVKCPLCYSEMSLYDVDAVSNDEYYECHDCNITAIKEKDIVTFLNSNGDEIDLNELKIIQDQLIAIGREESFESDLLKGNICRLRIGDTLEEKLKMYVWAIKRLNTLLDFQYKKIELFKKIGIEKK